MEEKQCWSKRRHGLIYEGGSDGLMVKEGPMALAGDGQDGRRLFSLVEEDGRLIGRLQFGGAWRALSRGGLTLLTAAAAAVHEGLTESLKHDDMQVSDATALNTLTNSCV